MLAVRVRVLAVLVLVLVVAVFMHAVTVLVIAMRVIVLVRAMRVLAVLMALMLAVAMLVIAVLMHAVTVLVIAMRVIVLVRAMRVLAVLMALMLAAAMLVVAMRMIVLVSQVRLLVPKRRNKHLAKSVAQQVAADKHTPGLFLRLVARNGPRTFYQVKLDPLITAWQRTFCSSKLSKNASRRCVQKPNQVRWTWKLCVSQRHSLQVRLLVLLASWIFKNRTVKRASQKTIPPLVGNISIRRFGDNLCLQIHLCRKLLNWLGGILATWSKL